MSIPILTTPTTPSDQYWYGVGARYTMRVWDILRNAYTGDGKQPLIESYDSSMFGLDKYPISDESYRKPLNDIIIGYFIGYEIGYETDFQFRMGIASDMAAIMPAYNLKLAVRAAAQKEKDLLSTSDNITHTEADSTHKYLDTPQGRTENLDDNFLTNVSKDKSSGDSTVKGRSGSIGSVAGSFWAISWDAETEILQKLAHNFMGVFL